mgnify:CR=1 FL=1
MKKLLAILLFLGTIAFAESQYISATTYGVSNQVVKITNQTSRAITLDALSIYYYPTGTMAIVVQNWCPGYTDAIYSATVTGITSVILLKDSFEGYRFRPSDILYMSLGAAGASTNKVTPTLSVEK